MRRPGARGLLLGPLTAALAALAIATPAKGAPSDPIFVMSAPPEAPPGKGFEGPCGLAVDSKGSFYVSDYHHDAVDVFSGAREYLTQLAGIDPLDGPCGLAVDSSGRLYVNDYHRKVIRYAPSAFPVGPGASYGAKTTIDEAHPTGVAIDPATDYAYVNERTEIAVYEPSGARVIFEGQPYAIGQGSLQDGYGLAISAFPATAGRLYVPDAATDTVKVYDPATDKADPVGAIAPLGGFDSLRDSAVAVDSVTGQIYVADELHPGQAERPEAIIEVFSYAGDHEGHLKYNIVDARPPGLAVDNSPGGTQGRVYVTSGNTEGALLYGYGPGAATTAAPICAPDGACPGGGGGGGGSSSPASLGATASAQEENAPPEALATTSEVAQKGTLRVAVSGRFAPKRLPRKGTAPIAVTVGGQIATTDRSRPPQLQSLAIEINRQGRLQSKGLPTCPYDRIQPASSQRALRACRSALVGRGSFEAEITLAGQEPYPAKGKLLLFNGKSKGKPVLFGQLYAPRPFATSFVIVFAIKRIPRGPYGTELSAQLPKAMGSWGNLTAIEMRLSRRYTFKGQRRSYLSAGCPAPEGFGQAAFPLARASFGFAGGQTLSSTLNRSCRVG